MHLQVILTSRALVYPSTTCAKDCPAEGLRGEDGGGEECGSAVEGEARYG